MGYKTKVKTITIRFAEDHQFHGAEAKVKGMTFGEWEVAAGLDGGEGDKGGGDAIKRFFEHLVSWNLEDEDTGQPIPPTIEAAKKVDKDLITGLNNAWVNALIGVHDGDPLPESSPSGEPSPVESIPMETPSESLAS